MMAKQYLSYIPQLATGLLRYTQDSLHLLVDPSKPAWAVINPTGMEIVELCDGSRDIQTIAALLSQKYQIPEEKARQDVFSYIHNLAVAELLYSDEDKPTKQFQTPAFKGIYLHVTNSCNLKCKHCYATEMGSGELLSFKEICGLIDQLAQMGGDSIILSGGEPLLRNDIKQILAYASKNLKTILLTNGILIDEEIVEFLSNSDIYVQISLDGITCSVHNSIRGEGTFHQTMRAIELLLARNMEKQLALSVSIMRSNLMEVPKLIEFALQSGISQVIIRPVIAQGNASLNWEQINPTQDEYAQLFSQIYPLLFEHREKLMIRGCLSDFIFGTLTDPQKRGCPAGEKLMIDSNGDVYPCPIMSHPDYLLGNVKNESLSDIRNSARLNQMCRQFADRVEQIAKCQACQWRGFCRAACPGIVLWQKDTIWDTDALCDVRASFYRKLIFEYADKLSDRVT